MDGHAGDPAATASAAAFRGNDVGSRIYEGLWSVLLVWTNADGTRGYGSTSPGPYEEAERLCLLIGMGVPYEDRRVERALIVGPVAGSIVRPDEGRHGPQSFGTPAT